MFSIDDLLHVLPCLLNNENQEIKSYDPENNKWIKITKVTTAKMSSRADFFM